MSTDAARTTAGGRVRGESLLLGTLALLTCVTAVVSSLGAPLVPRIARDYGIGLSSAQWVLTAALLAGAVATPLVGRLGAGTHRRAAVIVTLAVVTAGCLLSAGSAAWGTGFGSMAAGRALQGVGMAMTPVAIAVARDAIPEPRTAPSVALLSVTTVAGAGLGYPVTGLVVEATGTATAYAVGAGLSALTLVLCARLLPERRAATAAPVDWVGAVLLALGTLGPLLAVTRAGAWGWTSLRVLVLVAGGAVVLVAWVAWTRRRTHPLVDLRLAVDTRVLPLHVTALLAGMGMYYLLSLAVIVVQAPTVEGWGLGRGVLTASLLLVPYSVTSVLGSRAALMVGRRTPALLLPVGCAMFLGSTAWLAYAHRSLWQVLVAMGLGGIGSGFTFSSLPLLLIPHVPEAETSSALAVNQLVRFVGMAVGSAVCVVVMTSLGSDGGPGEVGFRDALLAMSGAWVLVLAAVTVLAGRHPRAAVPGQELEVVHRPLTDG